ncbi:MAG: DUF3179 domain-containing protein [Elusimicrobia bacterium]|nr:DUF3179 domain-containing protein [Elusimicrobiota bacterium]
MVCIWKWWFLLWTCFMTSMAAAQDPISGRDPVDAFLHPRTKTSVPLEELLRGGPPVDGIPALTNPKKLRVKEADRILAPDDAVLGILLNGESSAYPIRLLNWHEIANDTVGGVPIAVTYCPLCRSGIVFDRRVDSKETEFGVSGLLYKSDLVMYDRSSKSLWSQILGQAIAGPSTGKALKRLPAVHTTWKEWGQKHPDTTVAAFTTGHGRDYSRDPYQGYESRGEIYFSVGRQDPRLHPKEPVFGIRQGRNTLAVPERLVREKGAVRAKLGGEEIVFRYQDGVRAFRKDGGEIPGATAYWFAWFAFYPKTKLVLSTP